MYPQVSTNIKGGSSSCQNKRPYPRCQSIDVILTSTLVPGVHWMIRFNSVSFRDSRPSFQSMVHGRYGHTTGYDPFRRYGLMIMSIGNSIKDTSSTRILIKHGSIRGSSRTICCLNKNTDQSNIPPPR